MTPQCIGCARGEKLDDRPVLFHISEVDGLPSMPCRAYQPSVTAADVIREAEKRHDAQCNMLVRGAITDLIAHLRDKFLTESPR